MRTTQNQQALDLDPAPEQVREEIERQRLSSRYWRKQYRSLEELMADPERARRLSICARQALRARWQGG